MSGHLRHHRPNGDFNFEITDAELADLEVKPEPKQLNKVHEKIAQLQSGLITSEELECALDKLRIRGAMQNDVHYVGYDYLNQEWIETTFPSLADLQDYYNETQSGGLGI